MDLIVIGELKTGMKVTAAYHGTGKIYPVGTKAKRDKAAFKQQKNEAGEYINHAGVIWGKGLAGTFSKEVLDSMTAPERLGAATWTYWELPSAEQAAQDFANGYNPVSCRTEFDEEYTKAWKALCKKFGKDGKGTMAGDEFNHPLDD